MELKDILFLVFSAIGTSGLTGSILAWRRLQVETRKAHEQIYIAKTETEAKIKFAKAETDSKLERAKTETEMLIQTTRVENELKILQAQSIVVNDLQEERNAARALAAQLQVENERLKAELKDLADRNFMLELLAKDSGVGPTP